MKRKNNSLLVVPTNGYSPAESIQFNGNSFMKVSIIIQVFVTKCNETLKIIKATNVWHRKEGIEITDLLADVLQNIFV